MTRVLARPRQDTAGAATSSGFIGCTLSGWCVFYRWRNQQPWTLFLFIFVLISPTILYLTSILILLWMSFVNYKTHYYSNHRAFFVFFALYSPVDFVDTMLKGIPHFVALGPLYSISSILFLAGLVTAAYAK